jgi:hypothetical protein
MTGSKLLLVLEPVSLQFCARTTLSAPLPKKCPNPFTGLTLQILRRKSKASTVVNTNFYAQWRIRTGLVSVLREDRESPPEALLQAIWQHQRLRRDELKTADGRTVLVLHPGFRSVEGGPDFRGAVVQFGDDAPVSGEVEVDIRPSGWRAHGHDRNPAFEKVILRVVWETAAGSVSSPGPPLLALRSRLDAPIGELSVWLGPEGAAGFPETLRGKCCAPLRELKETQQLDLLRQAAAIRLQSKANVFQARARQAGWEQALWEGLFRALGYKHNVWAMQRLGELRPRWNADHEAPITLEARLLGLSGMLPTELPRSQNESYLRKVWDLWWRERDAFADCILPPNLWRFHGLRPANHPQRRLALASEWSANGQLAARHQQWCQKEIPERRLASSLLEVLQVPSNDFWSWHCTFRSPRLKKAQPLLGQARVTDLAVNVILPWLWIRADEGRNKPLQASIEQRYFAWPPAEDNSLLRLARQRLLGGAARKLLKSAAVQQGLIQIVRDFCDRSNALCDDCQFPKLVQDWTREAGLP